MSLANIELNSCGLLYAVSCSSQEQQDPSAVTVQSLNHSYLLLSSASYVNIALAINAGSHCNLVVMTL